MKSGRKINAALAVITIGMLGACAADRLHNEGLQSYDAGEYETAMQKLEQAVEESPGNATYRLDLKSKREAAVQALIGTADQARAIGKLDDAVSYYQRALGIEPGNTRAQRGLENVARDRRHAEILAQAAREIEQGKLDEAEARLRLVLAEDPGSKAAVALRAKIDNQRGPRNVTPRLRTRDNRPVSLQFRDASTKMVFEVLARQTGINFVFDKDIRNDGKTTIFVQQVPVEQAIDLVLGQNQLGRQVLSENMVMVYPNTPAKQKEYQDQVVRTFYMSNTDSKKTAEMLKTVLGAKTLYVDERSSAVIMRDTPESLRMAERLIASIDVAEPEVMLEVEVLELTRSRAEQIGVKYPQSVYVKPTPLAGDPLVLKDLAEQDSTTLQVVTPVIVGVDIRQSLGVTNVLASPRIRARNREKAKILIGQRVPVITTSTVLTTGGSGSASNVQYVDVGLMLDVEPTIHLDGDVAIKVNLEVSSILSTVEVGDSLAYQIGTRNASTILRLKDGETQVLAGLISDQDRRNSDGLPGLGDMPILGRLFSTKKVDGEKTEIVLSITPRIIRSQPRPSSDNTEFWYGTENALRGSSMAGSLASAPVAPRSTAAAANVLASPVGESADQADVQVDAAGAPGAPAAVPKRPELSWQGPGEVKVGDEFEVTLRMDSESELTNLRSVIRFDSAVLELVSMEAGSVVPEDARGALRPVINQRSGRAQFDLPAGNLSGQGDLVQLRFRALSPRPASMIAVQQFAVNAPDGTVVPTMAPRPITVVVKQ